MYIITMNACLFAHKLYAYIKSMAVQCKQNGKDGKPTMQIWQGWQANNANMARMASQQCKGVECF